MTEPLGDCLGFRLSSAYRRMDRLVNRAFSRLDLTSAHGHVLICVLEEGELRIADISARTGFDPSTVSRLVKELCRRRLIKRRKHPDDGRASLLLPASRGEALREPLGAILRRLNAQLRRDLTSADQEGFLHTMAVMDRLP
ncbi:MAG: MarR family winged helix-turn-helix transcriptional regulator [Planctomycetota bacterium]